MEIIANKRLFWFLKEGARLNLDDAATLDMYVQQVVTRGHTQDVKALLNTVPAESLSGSIRRLGRFLPKEVRLFWEDLLGNH